jgi:hypothetical protein
MTCPNGIICGPEQNTYQKVALFQVELVEQKADIQYDIPTFVTVQ